MKSERSIRRIVSVSSIVVGLIFGFASFVLFCVLGEGMREEYEPKGNVPYNAFGISILFGVICGASVWVIFFILRWIVRGFRSVTKK